MRQTHLEQVVCPVPQELEEFHGCPLSRRIMPDDDYSSATFRGTSQ
ncbi:hypothetical protein ACFFX0_02445 [Citricoccus parietis]|uniref:Uncharacterized protein n=1 Tax=Citricoccus parietis TaxID=592307 RepID=A0ABV5FTW3_9MICC